MNWFFSDRNRFHKLGAAILLIGGLCIHTHIVGNQYAQQRSIILKQCLINPESCVNKPLAMRVKTEHSPDGSFIAYPTIRGGGYSVSLSGELSKIPRGYVIDIFGAFTSDSTFDVIKFQRNDWIRPVKYSISFLGLVFTIILLSRRYRLSANRLLPLIHRE